MDKKIIAKLKKTLNILVPDNGTNIRTVADLTNSPNPAIRELCEAAELVKRLSKGEGA